MNEVGATEKEEREDILSDLMQLEPQTKILRRLAEEHQQKIIIQKELMGEFEDRLSSLGEELDTFKRDFVSNSLQITGIIAGIFAVILAVYVAIINVGSLDEHWLTAFWGALIILLVLFIANSAVLWWILGVKRR